MNVVILCGGRGTRLAGLWDRAKCLVPLGDGQPIIVHLIRRAHALQPHRIIIVTGHRGDEIADELRRLSLLHPRVFVHREAQPSGTASAVRAVAHLLDEFHHTLVFNGDTLPRYNLSELVQCVPINGCWRLIRAVCGGKPAGAVLLGSDALRQLLDAEHSDLDAWLDNFPYQVDAGIYYLHVCGYLDVGTPRGFELARTWTEGL